jgi:hypothetical protein
VCRWRVWAWLLIRCSGSPALGLVQGPERRGFLRLASLRDCSLLALAMAQCSNREVTFCVNFVFVSLSLPMCCRFAFVEGITSGMEDGTDSLPHLTNVKPDPDAPAAKPAAGATPASPRALRTHIVSWRLCAILAAPLTSTTHQGVAGCTATLLTCQQADSRSPVPACLPTCLFACVSAWSPDPEREPQPADEGGQLQLQLLDADKSEPQPLGLESSFQEYLRWVGVCVWGGCWWC